MSLTPVSTKPMSLLRRAKFQFWRYAEPRAVFEWQSFYVLKPLLKRLSKGDGHPVIVYPGFGSSDRATKPLRNLLSDLGYEVHGWGLGSNVLFDHHIEDEMIAQVRDLAEKSKCKVSLIGWSLGGLFAREVAKACSDQVRCVISMGTPISSNTKHSNASSLFQALNGAPTGIDRARQMSLSKPPPVPTTSIYSKTDGIVAWEGSVQKDAEGSVQKNAEGSVQKCLPLTENIEVPASHLGIGVNPLVMVVLADRLVQPEGQWRPFKPKGLTRLIYKRPSTRFT